MVEIHHFLRKYGGLGESLDFVKPGVGVHTRNKVI